MELISSIYDTHASVQSALGGDFNIIQIIPKGIEGTGCYKAKDIAPPTFTGSCLIFADIPLDRANCGAFACS